MSCASNGAAGSFAEVLFRVPQPPAVDIVLAMLSLLLFPRRILALRSVLNLGRFVLGVVVLFLFQFIGSWLVGIAHAAIPGSVIGMMLLAAAVHLRMIPMWLVRPASDFLVRHLALLYVPAGVAIVLYVALFRSQWLAVTAAALASLVAVLLVVGVIVQRLERRS